MKRTVSLSLLLAVALYSGSYRDNHSCKECHEDIYDEFTRSSHSKTYFNDELHRKISRKVDRTKYECAPCHMPASDKLADLVKGDAVPDESDVKEKDGISCFFCHTIAYVKESHNHNINLPARQADGYKPSLFGSLENPDDNDKHSSIKSPIYRKNACKGCHSHKRNGNGVLIFRAMKEGEGSEECIKCHMPKIPGGVEKMNKKSRMEHYSHLFPGIRNESMRSKAVDMNISVDGNKLHVTMHNKMGHPLIIQPSRAKYLTIEILRDGKVLWKNYRKSPSEDRDGYFESRFYKDGKEVVIPADATEKRENNIDANETKELTYDIPSLKKGDIVKVSLYVTIAKSKCAGVVELDDTTVMEPLLMKSVEEVIK